MNDLSDTYREVSAKVKRACDWDTFDHARLQISVGQDYHEGMELKATLEWASNNFETVTVCVNDTLQRHNYEFTGTSPEDAYRVSMEDGEEWIGRNLSYIESYPNIMVVRWNEWRDRETYSTILQGMHDLYDTNKVFRKAVDDEITNFWQRRKVAWRDDMFSKFKHHSKEYLLEECAVFSIMFSEQEAADVYPGSTLLPCSLLKGMGKYGFTRLKFQEIKPKAA